MEILLAIGTRKGLWLARSRDRRHWDVSGPQFPIADVKAIGIDMRRETPRLSAAVLNSHFGPTVVTSDDLGETWSEPDDAPVSFPEDTGAALEGVWQFAYGPESDVVYVGVEPTALFKSVDGGRTYEFVRGLWDHPHREHWMPGGGGKALHTVLPDPRDPARVNVAMSTGGVYRTEDGGASWTASNSGIFAEFMPEGQQYPEYGQCVHKVAVDAANPDRQYLQNHSGVYRSADGGRNWESIAEGLPADFGFPMVAHPSRSEVIYSFPLESSMMRFPPQGRCRVYRSENAGNSWTGLSKGLPDVGFWSAVMRDAMCTDSADPAGVYFGSRSGEVWASADEGDTWAQVAGHLPDVLCVRAAVI
ncbi:WD40/YVTN/BNR-like repeat-containing protein [Prauserella flavalba]|uniref:Glycosyl hydrolase n=1 Tax=Prauserella flavalba TaxID=1477506 RepID=A0A318L9M9_9PSEU|nr:exo-alpha-sialidase [Prauserella flavalba]PXY18012.1 glycosyl hydrolase [Prauserella flavalba]